MDFSLFWNFFQFFRFFQFFQILIKKLKSLYFYVFSIIFNIFHSFFKIFHLKKKKSFFFKTFHLFQNFFIFRFLIVWFFFKIFIFFKISFFLEFFFIFKWIFSFLVHFGSFKKVWRTQFPIIYIDNKYKYNIHSVTIHCPCREIKIATYLVGLCDRCWCPPPDWSLIRLPAGGAL